MTHLVTIIWHSLCAILESQMANRTKSGTYRPEAGEPGLARILLLKKQDAISLRIQGHKVESGVPHLMRTLWKRLKENMMLCSPLRQRKQRLNLGVLGVGESTRVRFGIKGRMGKSGVEIVRRLFIL